MVSKYPTIESTVYVSYRRLFKCPDLYCTPVITQEEKGDWMAMQRALFYSLKTLAERPLIGWISIEGWLRYTLRWKVTFSYIVKKNSSSQRDLLLFSADLSFLIINGA